MQASKEPIGDKSNLEVTNQDSQASVPSGDNRVPLRLQLSRNDATVVGLGIEIHCRMASFCNPGNATSASLDIKGLMTSRGVDNSMLSNWAMSCMELGVMGYSVGRTGPYGSPQ